MFVFPGFPALLSCRLPCTCILTWDSRLVSVFTLFVVTRRRRLWTLPLSLFSSLVGHCIGCSDAGGDVDAGAGASEGLLHGGRAAVMETGGHLWFR